MFIKELEKFILTEPLNFLQKLVFRIFGLKLKPLELTILYFCLLGVFVYYTGYEVGKVIAHFNH